MRAVWRQPSSATGQTTGMRSAAHQYPCPQASVRILQVNKSVFISSINAKLIRNPLQRPKRAARPLQPLHCQAVFFGQRHAQQLRAPLDNEYLLGIIWQQRRRLVIAAVCLLFCVSSNLASPVLSGSLFEILVKQQPLQQYGKLLAMLAAMYVLEPVISGLYVESMCRAADEVVMYLRCETLRILLLQRIAFFDGRDSTDLTQVVAGQVEEIRTFVYNNVTRDRGLRALLEAVGASVVLFCISWRLGPLMAGVIVATGFTVAQYRLQTKAADAARADALARVARVAQQAFQNIRTVRSYNGEAFERERFVGYVHEGFRQDRKLGRAKALMEMLNRGCIHVSLLALYGLGGYLVHQELLPIGALLTGIGFTYSLVYATQGIVQTSADLRRLMTTINRVQLLLKNSMPDPAMNEVLPPGAWWEIVNGWSRTALPAHAPKPVAPAAAAAGSNGTAALDTAPNATAAAAAGSNGATPTAVQAAARGPLELRDVDFAYPMRPKNMVLRGLSLILPQGTVTAIVGRSGSGKSTVAALLSRFYQPLSGSITLGGVDAQQFTQSDWTKAIAMVSQEPVLFSGTISDNIAYGTMSRRSREDVVRAAMDANAHDFISMLPDGYDTVVGEGGLLLSGGQRQRIAIARALLKDAPVLILDEATSALDTTSERLVQAALERLTAGRTVLVIAHRLSTVQAADQIVVLEEGQVVEVGTHEELVTRKGMYASLVSSQSLTLSLV